MDNYPRASITNSNQGEANIARYLKIKRFQKKDGTTIVHTPNLEKNFGNSVKQITTSKEQNNYCFCFYNSKSKQTELHDIMLEGILTEIKEGTEKTISFNLDGKTIEKTIKSVYINIHTMYENELFRYIIDIDSVNPSTIELQFLAKIYNLIKTKEIRNVSIKLGAGFTAVGDKSYKNDWVSVSSGEQKIENSLITEKASKLDNYVDNIYHTKVPNPSWLDSKDSVVTEIKLAFKGKDGYKKSNSYLTEFNQCIELLFQNLIDADKELDKKPFGDYIAPTRIEEDPSVLPTIQKVSEDLPEIDPENELPVINVDDLNVQMPF